MYLSRARNSISEQVYKDYVNSSNPMILALQGWIQMIDKSTNEMFPEWGKNETSGFFAEYCQLVGEADRQYWKKIYLRIGLDYDSNSPKGNSGLAPIYQTGDLFIAVVIHD